MSATPPQNNGRANGRKKASRRHRAGRLDRVFAALDLGTNNCRLLVARPLPHGFTVVDGFSRIVRLGEGVSEAGMLSDAAIERTVDALRVCARKMGRRRVTNARCVATQAARSAQNSAAFVDRVRDETGIYLEVISSREEAELTLTGCLPLLDPGHSHALLFDVGGGSAEFVWARILADGGAEIEGWISLPCGVVTLTERHGASDFSALEYEDVVGEVVEMLRPFEERFGISEAIRRGAVQMLGTAGTVTTIAGVDMALPRYNRSRVDGCWLAFDAVERVSRELAGKSYEERAAHPCIGHSRADLIVAGCAVLEAVCRLWPAGRLRVADRGVREGILAVMAGQPPITYISAPEADAVPVAGTAPSTETAAPAPPAAE